ncbi:ABC transporter permease [Natranaerobius thermophilus]|uniref:Binding-protein-dependent transport systems inner membrane component n=1 Tax=Natranaerobius thermophilus (strain ATCC BAA-1301 / DSM 18059 / JW/NM-WN-LF) TaxID=457570 RepID=B2A0T8_NATTJ|nr:ABC transporter permease [Natranaerobius thermophilus]ACB85968.1 binding-protein-dependent transport systems inner membrane component [Natranaerobius thermophilus JW/NM-WN-LF]
MAESETQKNTSVTESTDQQKTEQVGRSQWAEAWRRLKRNKSAMVGLFLVALLFVTAIFADVIAPYDYAEQNYDAVRESPSSEFLLGTDHLGRCILSRIIHGTRLSIQVGFIAIAISLVSGSLLGAIAGYFGHLVDNVVMRVVDIILSIPPILLAIAIVSAIGPSLTNLFIAVGIGFIPQFARIVRGSVLTLKEEEFVEAAQALGAKNSRIIVKHIIPNALAPIIVQATLGVAMAILSAAGLSFIGLGAQPPAPEWGAMLSDGMRFIRDSWWISTFPGLAIALTILGLNLFGDGLRDALDPRLKD